MTLRRFLFFLLVSIFSLTSFAQLQKTFSGYVGDAFNLEASTPSNQIYSFNWAVIKGDASCITLHTAGGYAAGMATVQIVTYFTETIRIRIFYHTTDNQNKTEYFDIQCNPVYLNVSPSVINLNKTGDTDYITYTTSPSTKRPTVVYNSANNNVAKVNTAGMVTAVGKGSTTITLSNSMGPEVTVKVNVTEDPKPKLVLSASHSGGEVSAGTTVTLAVKADGSTVSGCDIYYTTNGTTPSRNNGTKYSSGITINSACTLKAIAYKSGYTDSEVLTATYTITPNPKLVLSASPSSGQVSAGTTVTLIAKADGSTVTGCDIYYTLNGKEPSKSNGTKYSSGITINSSCTLKAIAYKSGYTDSEVLTATYTITPNPRLVLSASPSSGQVSAGTTVTLIAKADGSTVYGCDIYYTLNGSTPTKNSTKYTSLGITISSNCTLKAIAYKDGYETSNVLTESYTIPTPKKLTLTASPSGGQVASGTKVTLTAKADGSSVSGCDIYYTLNGSTPTKSSTKYTSSGITISSNCTLKAIAYKDGYETSNVLIESYTIPAPKKLTLTASPSSGQVASGTKVTLTAKADGSTVYGCDIYYTLNGSTPTKSSGTKYSSGITINSACTLKAIAYKDGYETSAVLTEKYTIEPTSISLPASKTVKVGESFTMTYTLTPSNATTTLTWSSDDTNIATVSSSGLVKGINAGSTYINVKTSNGKTDSCKVTVDDKPKEFIAKTIEGVDMKFQVISESDKTCQVGNGYLAISESYSGKITIPAKANGYSVISIGESAFHSSKISFIVIPNCIQKISSWALFNCRSLKSIEIPNSVTDIGERALSKSAIETIVVDNGNAKYDSRNGCNAIIRTSSNELVAGCSKTVIPSSVNSIGDDAFYYCIDLYKIDIPLSVEKIGKAAFSYSGLTEVVIPNSVKSIGWHAFSWCDNLLHVTIGSSVKSIDEHAFINNESLISVTSFIDNPFEINTNVFQLFSLDIDNKPSNATLYIPKGKKSKYMSTAGWNMFRRIVEENDKNGTTFKASTAEGVEMTFRIISESDKICQVGDNPYAGTDGSIYGRRAVSYNTSGNITIPSNINGYKVMKIADLAFINCPDITSVEMPNTITDIGGYAFQNCSGLTSFSLPNSVEIIGKYAISMCSGLRKVTLPEGLISVEDGLFWKDESLLAFNLPSTLKEIGYSVFIGCNSLTSIYSYMQTPCDYYPSSIFENDAYNNATLFVPNGTKAAYTRQDYWYMFKNIVEFDLSPKLTLAASPSGGQVSSGTKVYLTAKADGSTISDCDIYYTLDGTTPSKSSTKYMSSGISINEDCTLKAIAYKDGYETSDVLTISYTVIKKLELSASPSGGEVKKGSIVTLTVKAKGSTVSGYDIYYTLNDATPTKSSAKYTSSGITINEACTLKAIAYKDGYETSDVLTETYTIKVEDYRLSIASSGYATFYSSESAYKLPDGLSAQVVKAAGNGKLTYENIIIINGSNMNIVPKGVPVMIESNAHRSGTYMLTAVQSGASYTGTNLLRGSDEATTTTGDGYHYKLSYGPSGTGWSDVFGWYWGAQNGAPFQIEGHKVWLVVPRGSGTRAAGFSIDGESLRIDDANLNDNLSDDCFDLQGRRVSQPTKKGIYIRNGHKIVNR